MISFENDNLREEEKKIFLRVLRMMLNSYETFSEIVRSRSRRNQRLSPTRKGGFTLKTDKSKLVGFSAKKPPNGV